MCFGWRSGTSCSRSDMRQLVCLLMCVSLCALLRNGSAETECPAYEADSLYFYREYGCTVSNTNGCVKITNCPRECVGADGITRSMAGSWWKEGNSRCECVSLYGTIFSLPDVPPDGVEYPVTKDCMLEGCEHPDDKSFIEPGGQVTRENGQTCRCASGADPDLADAGGLYHLSCDGDFSEFSPLEL